MLFIIVTTLLIELSTLDPPPPFSSQPPVGQIQIKYTKSRQKQYFRVCIKMRRLGTACCKSCSQFPVHKEGHASWHDRGVACACPIL